MSVEAFVISGVIEDGSVKKALQAGITRQDFVQFEEEWTWILEQHEHKRPINWRRFQQTFDDFEKVVSNERLQDLCLELKQESAFMAISSAIDQVGDELRPDNAIEKAEFLREIVTDIVRVHSPANDVILSDHKAYLKGVKELMLLRDAGIPVGIPTGIPTLDNHYGGLVNGRCLLILGRPGDAKSMFLAKLACSAFLDGRRVGLFSPEMNEVEHRARIATLISANEQVQEYLGLNKAFRNRALMDGKGFNYKTLKRFWEWYESEPGEIILFNRQNRRQKMSPAYIDAKVDDYGLEMVVADPIYKMRSGEKLRGWEELQAITDMLCDMSEIHNMPVVMSNQAGRNLGNRGDAPHKDSSFNGDAPVQEADHVIGVKHVPDEKKLILRCTKNRFGQDFRVDLKFVPNIGIMEDVSFKEYNYFNGSEDGSEDRVKEAMNELESEMQYDRR